MTTKKRVNKPTDKRFPQALADLAAILEVCAAEAPLDVQRIALASRKAMMSNDPRVSINKRLVGLRTAHPTMFTNALNWLWMGKTEALFIEYGSAGARAELELAFIRINNGETPHVALGMDKAGKPDSWNFTAAEDAAIYVQDLHLNQGYSIDSAMIAAEDAFGTDKSNTNRVKMPKGTQPSDLKIQRELIESKLNNKPNK